MTDVVVDVLKGFDVFVLAYFLVLNTIQLGLVGLAGWSAVHTLRRPDWAVHDDVFANPMTPPISLLLCAYNEAEGIVASTRAALGLRYPELEVVVIDDGSEDDTFERLRAEFDLLEAAPALDEELHTDGAIRSLHVPRGEEPLVVVRKVNTGNRADALNAGLNAARHPLVCCVDGDSLLEEDALLRVARPFVDDPDRVVATGGAIRAANGSGVHRGQVTRPRLPRDWLVRIQVVEYLRSFHLGRTGWSRMGALLIISGAFGLYRRDLLVEVGGFDQASLGEDADVIVAMHRLLRERDQDYRIVYVPEPVCWTEVPSSRAVLARQRRRWSHGLAQVLWKQRAMIGRPRYGRPGVLALPYYLLFELLGPVIELVGVVAVVAGLALGVINTQMALVFAAVALLYGIGISISALLVEELAFPRYRRWRDLGSRLAAAVVENIGFRQLHAWWRMQGLVAAVRQRPMVWGEMTRTGFTAETDW